MTSVCLAALLLTIASDPVEIDGLKSTPPDSWKATRPSNNMQYRAFSLPKAEGDEGDTSLVIFFFGAGGGGDLNSNLERWKKQIEPPAGKTREDIVKIEHFKVGNVKVAVFDATGIYLFKPFPASPDVEKKPNYRLINVYFESPNGPYFFRLVGPVKSVTAQEKGFKDWVKNFK